MRLAAAALFLAWSGWTGLSSAESGPSVTATFDQGFSLRVGQSAQTSDGALRIGFDGVTADSRCAKGQQCVRAGDATVRLWVQQGQGAKQPAELRTAPRAAQALFGTGHALRLLSLEPFPVNGKSIAREDYVVTLMLSRDSQAAPER